MAARRRRPTKRSRKEVLREEKEIHSDGSEDEGSAYEPEEKVEPKTKGRGGRGAKGKKGFVSSSDDDEDINTTAVAPPKKRTRTSPRRSKALSSAASSSSAAKKVAPIFAAAAEGSRKKKTKSGDKNKFEMVIREHESMIVVEPSSADNTEKIAAFDMDWTLVKPKGKNKFSNSRTDWVWLWPQVTKQVQKLHSDGYRILIVTNQNGIGTGKIPADAVTYKIIDLADDLDVPLTAILTTGKDIWRKPNTNTWTYFEDSCNGGIKADKKVSFYCGDAAGRVKAWKDKTTKKDFSASDRKFAFNVGVPFHTPDAYFLGEKECTEWGWGSLNPETFLKDLSYDYNTQIDDIDASTYFHGQLPIAKPKGGDLDMVIMMGCPGSGKSTFSKTHLVGNGYEWINRDTLKTPKKCLVAAEAALKKGKNVVIDNTNPNGAARAPYIALGGKYKANVRVFRMTMDKTVAQHLNLYREKYTNGVVARIKDIVFNIHFKKVREGGEPDKSEGIDEICTVDFVPQFANQDEKKLFLQFT